MPATADNIARVYARSLFELAVDAGGQDKAIEIADELAQLVELTRSDVKFGRFIHSPVIDANRRGTALGNILQDRVSDLTLRFLLVLNKKQRLGHLESIHTAILDLVHEAMGRVEVDVWTAVAMDDATSEVVTAGLRTMLHKEPVVNAAIDASILGGLKVRVGDKLIDNSIATQLRQLEHTIKSGAAHRIASSVDSFIEGSPSSSPETGKETTGPES
jgi:F-type H+-transporting ATPase subunit delta